MEDNHRTILRENRVFLVDNLLPSPILFAHLRSNKTLTVDHVEFITNEHRHPTTKNKVGALLDEIVRRGPQAFRTLVEALVLSDQDHVADQLDKEIADSYRSRAENDAIPAIPVAGVLGGIHGVPNPGAGDVGGGDAAMYDTVDATNPEMTFNVKNASFEAIKTKLTERYPMSSDPRGRAIIVNVENFTPESRKAVRTGSQIDRNNLEKLCKQLNFKTDIWDDPTREEFLRKINLERDNADHSKADALMVFIMSHGSEGVFYTVEGKAVNITKEVIDQFNGNNCKQLVGKPKMFFIQACQGKSKTLGVVPDGDEHSGSQPETKPDTVGSRDTFLKQATHDHADVLVTYSTVEGYESYRDKIYGTWFIRDLVKVFAASAHQIDVSRMVIRVSGLVDKHPEHKYKQVCVTKGSLKREIYLLPGYCD